MSTFDWCVRNQHDKCLTRYHKFWFEKRKRKEVMVFDEAWTECECSCHTDEPVVDSDKKPTKKPRRKK